MFACLSIDAAGGGFELTPQNATNTVLLQLNLGEPVENHAVCMVDHAAEWRVRCSTDGDVLRLAPISMQRDRSVVLAAVQNNGHALQWACGVLKGDKVGQALARLPSPPPLRNP